MPRCGQALAALSDPFGGNVACIPISRSKIQNYKHGVESQISVCPISKPHRSCYRHTSASRKPYTLILVYYYMYISAPRTGLETKLIPRRSHLTCAGIVRRPTRTPTRTSIHHTPKSLRAAAKAVKNLGLLRSAQGAPSHVACRPHVVRTLFACRVARCRPNMQYLQRSTRVSSMR